MGSTRCLDMSDSLPLHFLLSPVELEAPDPGDIFFTDPEGVEVTIVAAFLSALPLVPSSTVLPPEIALVGWSFDLEVDPELVVGVSTLSTGVSVVRQKKQVRYRESVAIRRECFRVILLKPAYI